MTGRERHQVNVRDGADAQAIEINRLRAGIDACYRMLLTDANTNFYVSLRDGMSTAADWFDVEAGGEQQQETRARPTYTPEDFAKAMPMTGRERHQVNVRDGADAQAIEINRLRAGIDACYRMLLTDANTNSALYKAEDMLRELLLEEKDMSGGSFDYACYRVDQFADELGIRLDEFDKKDALGYQPNKFEPETLAKLREIEALARHTAKLMKEAEWLYSGDTSDESFMERVLEIEVQAKQGQVDIVNSKPWQLGTEEPVRVTLVRYRDAEGNPTCAVDFQSGRVCMFYATQRLGCHETCWFADKDARFWATLQRRNGGKGTLVPLSTCPLWPNAKA